MRTPTHNAAQCHHRVTLDPAAALPENFGWRFRTTFTKV
jgi:hypothetical protein